MSVKKLLLLTAVVAALFAFIFFIERKMPTTTERQRKGDLYWDLPEERLTRLTLTRGAETLDFERPEGGRWRMLKPDAYPADSFAVNGAAGELTDLKRAAEDTADAKPTDYGLDKPVATARLAWTDADEPTVIRTRTIQFGVEIPGTDITTARVEGQTKVLFVPTSALTTVKKPVDDFRSRDVFEGSTSGVTRVEILRGRGRLLLARKEGVWWLAEPVADLADAGQADDLVRQLTALRVRDFLRPGDDLASLSLSPPLYHVSLTGDKGAVTAVDFGATRSDGNTIYARRENQVLTVDREIVDELSKESEAFRSTALVAFPRGDLTAVEATVSGAAYAFTQANGGWSFGGRTVLAAAADDVLNVISSAKSRGFVDAAEVKTLAPATATITLKTKAGAAWTIALHPRAADAVAVVSGRPGGFAVDGGLATQLEAAITKATVAPTPAPTKKP